MIIPVILGITFIVFSIMSFSPGDPAKIILGDGATEEAVQQLRDELGLDDPFFVRYFNYVKNALKGDFGKSYRTNIPVYEEIFNRFPVTLRISFFSICIAAIVGIPIGIIAAVKRYSILDVSSMIFTLLLNSMPAFWLGLLLILFFSLKLDLLPATGVTSWVSYILPSIALSGRTTAVIARMTRSSMLEVIRKDYIRTARSKGASEKRIIWKHSLRNAMIPVVTLVGINFGILLGSTILIESVFAMPGVGSLLITAIRTKDTPIVLADIILLASCFSLINLTVDIIYGFIDPRIKSQYN
ncbi:peptide/nickel transport system permease protein [Maledivibacter halophilus]|uniref:Peptide/nickel transport system permease protein n=2 Tax=Maledivibacter halophilus TaxID=36842 RepID=A0A1T5LSR6_9FIRM|nr:peptide/nickel transport system permease protein [Maledivibacter halophilus]